MDAVEGEDDHHDEVGDEERDVEGVPVVGVAEGVVGVVGAPVVGEASAGDEVQGERVELAEQRGLRGLAGYREILREGNRCLIT
jgi:hypothetical protein